MIDFRCFRSKMCFRTFSILPLNSPIAGKKSRLGEFKNGEGVLEAFLESVGWAVDSISVYALSVERNDNKTDRRIYNRAVYTFENEAHHKFFEDEEKRACGRAWSRILCTADSLRPGWSFGRSNGYWGRPTDMWRYDQTMAATIVKMTIGQCPKG